MYVYIYTYRISPSSGGLPPPRPPALRWGLPPPQTKDPDKMNIKYWRQTNCGHVKSSTLQRSPPSGYSRFLYQHPDLSLRPGGAHRGRGDPSPLPWFRLGCQGWFGGAGTTAKGVQGAFNRSPC